MQIAAPMETTVTKLSEDIRTIEASIAHLRDVVTHAEFMDLTPGNKKEADKIHEIQQKISDAGYELLLCQEIIHQLLSSLSQDISVR